MMKKPSVNDERSNYSSIRDKLIKKDEEIVASSFVKKLPPFKINTLKLSDLKKKLNQTDTSLPLVETSEATPINSDRKPAKQFTMHKVTPKFKLDDSSDNKEGNDELAKTKRLLQLISLKLDQTSSRSPKRLCRSKDKETTTKLKLSSEKKLTLKLKLKKKSRPKLKFKSVALMVYAYFVIKSQSNQSIMDIKLYSLRKFVFYINSEVIEDKIASWIFSSIKIPFLSLLKTDDNSIEKILDPNSSEDSKEFAYIKLETRLKMIIESLIETTQKTEINSSIKSFLSLLTSENVCLPRECLPKFVTSRLNISNGQFKNNNETQKKMILCFYLIFKFLLKRFFIDRDNLQCNDATQSGIKNVKILTSIIYRSVIAFFTRNVQSNSTNTHEMCRETTIEVQQTEYINKSFYLAIKRVNKKKALEKGYTLKIEESLLSKLDYTEMCYANDTSFSEVNTFDKALYSFEELITFYNLAKANNFSLMVLIWKWLSLLLLKVST